MTQIRAFDVDAAPTEELLRRTRVAFAAGWIPDTLIGGVHVGSGDESALDPVTVAPEEFEQLLERRRLPRWVAANGSFGPGYVRSLSPCAAAQPSS